MRTPLEQFVDLLKASPLGSEERPRLLALLVAESFLHESSLFRRVEDRAEFFRLVHEWTQEAQRWPERAVQEHVEVHQRDVHSDARSMSSGGADQGRQETPRHDSCNSAQPGTGAGQEMSASKVQKLSNILSGLKEITGYTIHNELSYRGIAFLIIDSLHRLPEKNTDLLIDILYDFTDFLGKKQ
jgi:hypothetical protein